VVSLSWAARELHIAGSTARALAERGKLPGAFKLGDKLWRVSVVRFRADVEALADIEANRDRARRSHPAGKGLRAEDQTSRAEIVELPLAITADAPIEGSAFLTGIASKDSIPVVPVDTVDDASSHRANRAPIAQTARPSRKRRNITKPVIPNIPRGSGDKP
jgi:hypothetical protein